MAARRERERRRPPTERQYRFGTPADGALDTDETLVEGEALASPAEAPAAPAPRAAGRQSSAVPAPARAHRAFSDYRDEYRYVVGDLRRIGIVIGSLLVILLVLYFVLPH
jgi:hypothetical protein